MIWALTVACALLWLRIPAVRRRPLSCAIDLDGVARLLLLSTAAGLPLGAALSAVAVAGQGPVLDDVRAIVRMARIDGLEPALLRAPERISPLAASLAHAHTSGAPLRPSLEAFLDRRRRQRVAEAVARARRLGVVLVAPLALLLLPGFVLLVFGPVVVDNLTDLMQP